MKLGSFAHSSADLGPNLGDDLRLPGDRTYNHIGPKHRTKHPSLLTRGARAGASP